MAVPDLIIRQNSHTNETAMNVQAMLADFLEIVTPKSFNSKRNANPTFKL